MDEGSGGSLSGLGGLSGVVQSFFLLQSVRNLSGVAKEIEILAHGFLSDGTTSKCVVVECILRLVKAITQAIICVFEV